MPERRFELQARLAAKGLPSPPADTLEALHDVLDERVLGASNHVAIALPLIARIASEEGHDALPSALETSAFIAETRGAAAPIVANALRWQAAGVRAGDRGAAAEILAKRAEAWAEAAAARRANLVEKAVTKLANIAAPMLFDYSGTVADIAVALAKAGHLRALWIPESRAIDGGRRYLQAFESISVPRHFIPDAAMDWAMGACDAVLLGAESVTRDGAILNTIGSCIAARSAVARGVPVYGAADLFKVGPDSSAALAAPVERDYDSVLQPAPDISTRAPELEFVAPGMITAILTERGPLTPNAVAAHAAEALGDAQFA